jgi:hypothetical protein
MITACGAEKRVCQKYGTWVIEAKKHGQFTAPLIALQFCLIVHTDPSRHQVMILRLTSV